MGPGGTMGLKLEEQKIQAWDQLVRYTLQTKRTCVLQKSEVQAVEKWLHKADHIESELVEQSAFIVKGLAEEY